MAVSARNKSKNRVNPILNYLNSSGSTDKSNNYPLAYLTEYCFLYFSAANGLAF